MSEKYYIAENTSNKNNKGSWRNFSKKTHLYMLFTERIARIGWDARMNIFTSSEQPGIGREVRYLEAIRPLHTNICKNTPPP